jgi:hypothetical protein
MNYYNGYSPKERSKKLAALHCLYPNYSHPYYKPPCHLCGDPTTEVQPHSEDYAEPFLWSVRQLMPCALTATCAFTVASTRRHRGSPTRHIYGAAASVPTCGLRRSLARSHVSRRHSSPVSRSRSHHSALRCTAVPVGGSYSLPIHDFSTNLLHVPDESA